MTTFTRKELVNTAIDEIRAHLRCYKSNGNISHVHHATHLASTLSELYIISPDKSYLLSDIISNMAFPNTSQITKD